MLNSDQELAIFGFTLPHRRHAGRRAAGLADAVGARLDDPAVQAAADSQSRRLNAMDAAIIRPWLLRFAKLVLGGASRVLPAASEASAILVRTSIRGTS